MAELQNITQKRFLNSSGKYDGLQEILFYQHHQKTLHLLCSNNNMDCKFTKAGNPKRWCMYDVDQSKQNITNEKEPKQFETQKAELL